MDRERVWRFLAYSATILTLLLAIAAWFYREDALRFIAEREQSFKLIGQGFGPILALLAFIWGLFFKAELAKQAHDAGEASAIAKTASREAAEAKTRVEEKEARIRELTDDLTNIAQGAKLWSLRGNASFDEYRGWKNDPRGGKILTIGLFKGGVGKTHVTANLAAYVSEKRQLPVLLIDLDFQGSLSTQMLLAAGYEHPGSNVDALFKVGADLTTVCAKQLHLARSGAETILNGGQGLSRAWLIPADYTLAQVEGQLLANRIVRGKEALDERYRLAHVLLRPEVRRQFALIIIDTPPRMTLGTVNALLASHAVVVPSILDRVSSEAFGPYISQLQQMRTELDVDLDILGIIASMTRLASMDDNERSVRDRIEATAIDILGPRKDGNSYVFEQNLPVRKRIRTSDDLAYFLPDSGGTLAARFYDPLFDELCARLEL